MAVISYRKGATARRMELKIENGELRMDNGCPRQMKQNSSSETMIQRYALATPNPSFISQLSILHSQLSILNYPFSILNCPGGSHGSDLR
jgi:hypothetical protein